MRVQFFALLRKHGRTGHELGRKKHIAVVRAELLKVYESAAYVESAKAGPDMRRFVFEVGRKRA